MKRIATLSLGIAVAAVIGVAAIAGGSTDDTPETGGLTPLAPEGVTEPDFSDPLFIDGEPVTGTDGDTVWVNNGDANDPETGGLTPLAPEDMPEPDPSDQVLFIDDEPVTPFEGDDVEGAGMAVPGFEGEADEMVVVEVGSGMAVPGFEGDVEEMIVDPN